MITYTIDSRSYVRNIQASMAVASQGGSSSNQIGRQCLLRTLRIIVSSHFFVICQNFSEHVLDPDQCSRGNVI